MLLDILTIVVVAYVGSNLVVSFRRSWQAGARRRIAELLRGVRPHHFLLAVPGMVGVFVTLIVLFQVPPLQFGWWTAIGGQGNVAFGTTERTAGTVLGWLIPLVFIVLLLPALPLLVDREERGFRLGAEDWSFRRRGWMGLRFGLLHLIAGIPIAAALAISVGGWWFTWVYLRAYRRSDGDRRVALDESTRVHLAYDYLIIALVLLAVTLGA